MYCVCVEMSIPTSVAGTTFTLWDGNTEITGGSRTNVQLTVQKKRKKKTCFPHGFLV